jgi:hypothetical protein
MNIKFCVKLGKNASDTCVMLSKAYGREAMRKSSVLGDINGAKRVTRTWQDDERSGRPRSQRPDENVHKERNLLHSDRLLITAMTV